MNAGGDLQGALVSAVAHRRRDRMPVEDAPADSAAMVIDDSVELWLAALRWAHSSTLGFTAQVLLQADRQQRLQVMLLQSTVGLSLLLLRTQIAPLSAFWRSDELVPEPSPAQRTGAEEIAGPI